MAEWRLLSAEHYRYLGGGMFEPDEVIGPLPPPGLLLSLGDGSAVVFTDAMLARAYSAAICRADRSHLEPEEARLSMARSMIEIAIQQAQEARDAG